MSGLVNRIKGLDGKKCDWACDSGCDWGCNLITSSLLHPSCGTMRVIFAPVPV